MKTIIFTDGSSRGNPGPGGWGAIVAYVEGKDKKIRELGGGNPKTTNNRMEMQAVLEALSFVKKNIADPETEILLYTDSEYVMKGATQWVFGWASNNWRTKAGGDVLNKDLWQKMIEVLNDLNVEWKVIPGHSGIAGNERCDVIATSFADENPTKLFYGNADNYNVSLETKQSFGGVLKSESKSSWPKRTLGKKAYSYVSVIKGMVKVHKTWDECKARVDGESSARYRKAMSKDEETKLINEFLR
jgi:ribonuclease HI